VAVLEADTLETVERVEDLEGGEGGISELGAVGGELETATCLTFLTTTLEMRVGVRKGRLRILLLSYF
jgi:hypothetical protein